MKEGETVFLRMFQDGGFQVHKYNFEFLLYEIPQYGGTADFVGCFQTVAKLTTQQEKIVDVFSRHSFGCQRKEVIELVSAMIGFDFSAHCQSGVKSDIKYGSFYKDTDSGETIFTIANDTGDKEYERCIVFDFSEGDARSRETSYVVLSGDVISMDISVDQFFKDYSSKLTDLTCIKAFGDLISVSEDFTEIRNKLGV